MVVLNFKMVRLLEIVNILHVQKKHGNLHLNYGVWIEIISYLMKRKILINTLEMKKLKNLIKGKQNKQSKSKEEEEYGQL